MSFEDDEVGDDDIPDAEEDEDEELEEEAGVSVVAALPGLAANTSFR